MISVITGDIINSKSADPVQWLEPLKDELNKYGPSPKVWEIYRGDSFQLIIKDPGDAFLAAVKIKAAIKTRKNLDVRLAIGIGEEKYDAETITESNGSAFVYSGEKLETLKKEKLNLAIKSDRDSFDEELNLNIKLGLIAMDNWTPNSAEAVKLALENQNLPQKELGQMLGLKQNTVSYRLKRAYFDEIMAINERYRMKLGELL
ncbi:MAG: SatD family protein [Pyrinomonadaceae bacterium]